ncbi:MAG: TetR family transcriptional regulator [Gemmatimonadaceae bacterium]|nr:TetR family transcriptional regulator [Gemmatimonadaceae bacterium]
MVIREVGSVSEKEGLRERKQRETRGRIAAKGLELFLTRGFDATTLDDIAEAAGISRRSFFSYFKSKDDLVIAWQLESWHRMLAELRTVSPDIAPLEAVRQMMVRNTAQFETAQMKAIDDMMRSSETLMARKSAVYIMHEETLFTTLCEIWRQPERQPALRMVAMVSIGVMRLAIESWRTQKGKLSAARVLDDTFAHLLAEMQRAELRQVE